MGQPSQSQCTLHPAGLCSRSLTESDDIALGVTGSPCNPYSTQRNKRFSDGSIAGHSMTDTTMESVVSFYQLYEPHCSITEQVAGFGMRTSHSDATTPLDKRLGSWLIKVDQVMGFWPPWCTRINLTNL